MKKYKLDHAGIIFAVDLISGGWNIYSSLIEIQQFMRACGLTGDVLYTSTLTQSLLSSYRQCAMAALNDVREYLSVEGGQVAVSSSCCSWIFFCTYSVNKGCKMSVFSCCFRSLMRQIQQEKEEAPSSSLLNKMGSRFVNQAGLCQLPWALNLQVYYIVLSIQVFFVESVCEDPDVIAQNIVVSYISFYSIQNK